jgi:hypothetical protein
MARVEERLIQRIDSLAEDTGRVDQEVRDLKDDVRKLIEDMAGVLEHDKDGVNTGSASVRKRPR